LGNYDEENYIVYPPYERPLFKLHLYNMAGDGGYIATSFGLIIQKGKYSNENKN